MKKICMILMCFLLLWNVSACKSGDGTGQEPPSGTLPTGSDLKISVAELPNYKIICPESSGDALNNVIRQLTANLSETLNISLTVQDDYFNNSIPGFAMGEYEILIGNTNRPESEQYLAGLKYQDYGYAMVGKKLVIAGYTEENTVKALSRFITLVLRDIDTDSEIFFSNEASYHYAAAYPFGDAQINGQSIGGYSIVYPARNSLSELDAAKVIHAFIAENYGHYAKIINDSQPAEGCAIWVGDVSFVTDEMRAKREQAFGNASGAQYYICSAEDGSYVWLSAGSSAGVLAAAASMRNLLTPAEPEKNVVLSLSDGMAASYGSNELTTMSFNLYSYDVTAERINRVVTLIRNYMPDTFGVQEATPEWMSALKNQLGSIYDVTGEGRNGGNKGEYNAVFYRKDQFRLIDSGTKWLSSTPDSVGSKTEGSSFPRIVTYAVLQHKSTDAVFVHANTHLDHAGNGDGIRLEQCKILLNLLSKLSSTYPVILTGDFNSIPSSEVYRYLTANGFADSSEAAIVSSQKDITSHGYKTTGGKIIDYVFVSDHTVIVNTYQVCKDMIDGAYPSDHFPVLAKYILLN